MKIRSRIMAVLLLGICSTSLTLSAGLLSLEWFYLQRQALERPALVVDPVLKVAEESILARDPMSLMSHLHYVYDSRQEIVALRVNRRGEWSRIRRPRDRAVPPPDRQLPVVRTVRVAVLNEDPEEVTLEFRFDIDVLLREAREVFADSLRTAVLIVSLIWLLAIPLSLWSVRRLLSAIEVLERGIERMASGKPVELVPVSKRDEMGALIGKFNRMSQKLADLDQMKKDFVSSVTHELRSPLAAISSFARLLKRNAGLDDIARSQLGRIETSVDRLGRFVDQLLESARIERGMFEIHPKETEIAELVRDSVLFYQARARELRIELIAELPDGKLLAEVDAERVTQIVTNLLSNALKYTPENGRVTAYARPGLLDGRDGIEVGVIDTGVGIKPEDLQRMFRPFERIENPLKTTGTGLGLSIAKTIAELHGGILQVDSLPGHGSRFYFTLPVRQRKEAGLPV